jgi:2-polyprenyl-6-methoxyphenol hydroxylase-like FAD-dependent oxidoreductase
MPQVTITGAGIAGRAAALRLLAAKAWSDGFDAYHAIYREMSAND